LSRCEALLAPSHVLNELFIETDKSPILESVDLRLNFLLIDDGALIDALEYPSDVKSPASMSKSTT
jgi:hypothetical protein